MSPTNTVNTQLFGHSAVVRFGGTWFMKVPTILQVDGIPLIETVANNDISRTTRFTIYNSDGVNLAKVIGTRLCLTQEGERSGFEVKYPSRTIVGMIGNQILFEVRRVAAASLEISAEIYAPTGLLVKATSEGPLALFSREGGSLATGATSERRIRNTAVGFSVLEQERAIYLDGTLVSNRRDAQSDLCGVAHARPQI